MDTPDRRTFLARAASLLVGAPAAGLAGPDAPRHGAEMTVDVDRILRPVNRLILGNNIDWTHGAQGMYPEESDKPSPHYLALADRLAPTALRYPGGTNADFYQWQNGIGPLSSRRSTRTLEGKEELVKLGTDEFLALCARWKAEPLITVNIATGTAQQAADWVRHANRRDSGLPRVRYWEIGNEPYLEASAPDTKTTPAQYARRANEFIAAMKAADPGIECGIVLRNDTLGGVEATPFKGFNDIVLGAVKQPFEFAALHSSYFPVTFEKKESALDMYLATMAGTRVMEQDMDATRAKLSHFVPGREIRLAVTEYNALYSLDLLRWGLASVFLSRTDRYIDSMAAALYVADALRVFSQRSDLLMANFWSLTGNWWFGAISHEGKPRPPFHVLEAYRDLVRGNLVQARLEGPTMDTSRSGFVPAMRGIPQVVGHAVDDGSALRVAVINKHPTGSVPLRVHVPGLARAKVTVREIGASGYFERDIRVRDVPAELRRGAVDLLLPKHSFTVVTLRR